MKIQIVGIILLVLLGIALHLFQDHRYKKGYEEGFAIGYQEGYVEGYTKFQIEHFIPIYVGLEPKDNVKRPNPKLLQKTFK